MQVMIKHDTLWNKVLDAKSKAVDLDDYIDSLSKMVLSINEVWQDETYDQFKTKMEEFIEELNNYKDEIDSFNEYVEGYLKINTELESTYYSKKIDLG